MTAWIASAHIFSPCEYSYCTGIIARALENQAMEDSTCLRNTQAKNQWFRVLIPEYDTFLSLDNLFQNQPYSLLEQLTTNDALSKLYINEGRDFMIGLDKYLQSLNLADNPDAAHQEIKEYYAAKEQEILSLSIPDYLKYIYGKTLNRDSSVVSAYLYQFGVSGLTFLDTQGRSSFLLFSPRKDMVIKEIRRQSPAYTLLAS